MDQDAVWGSSALSHETFQHIRIFASSTEKMRKLADAQEEKLISLVLETNKPAFHPITKPGPTNPFVIGFLLLERPLKPGFHFTKTPNCY